MSGAAATTGQVALRQAVPADAPALFALQQASVQQLCAAAYPPAVIEAWFEGRSPAMYEPALSQGKVWLGEQAGRMVGFLAFEPGEVTLLFVHPAEAGRGVGSVLLGHALRLAQPGAQGPVMVLSMLNARPFYEKHGFRKTEDATLLRGLARLPVPVVRMERVVAPMALPAAGA